MLMRCLEVPSDLDGKRMTQKLLLKLRPKKQATLARYLLGSLPLLQGLSLTL